MRHFLYAIAATALMVACTGTKPQELADASEFIRIEGPDLIAPDGSKFFIKGTNLGNWLNPEGYMFGFKATNSPRLINEMLCQLVGPDRAADFWQDFKDNYITENDIRFIASTGANTVRLPFHYKLFSNEDYMGRAGEHDGYERIDSVVEWCRRNDLRLILDMHDAPGGQTGDNIDDSYGYPFLFESERAQQQFCDIWSAIAERYANEPVILGYELINEPIAHFHDTEALNPLLEKVHKKGVAAIRQKDKNHIILLGGAQWNSNFSPFTDWTYDDKIMYTCHRYGGEPTAKYIDHFIGFRDSTNLPMYMGEIGHNTDEWQAAFSQVLEDNNIGYTYWPYKKLDGECMMAIERPALWDSIVAFAEADRHSYSAIREARIDTALSHRALADFLENCKSANCTPQKSYIRSMKLNID